MIRRSEGATGGGAAEARSAGATPRRTAEAYARYARILQAQLEALSADEPDLKRFEALAGEREAAAREIDRATNDADELLTTVLAEIRAHLIRARDSDRRVRERLGQLRDQTLNALGSLKSRKTGREAYLAEEAGAPARPQLDVRF